MNDWKLRTFLIVAITTQISVWSLEIWKEMGVEIPVIRQILGFVCFAYLPGITILRILGLHERNPIEILLYSVGLSLSFVMLIGLIVNVMAPAMGIDAPISESVFLPTFGLAFICLCVICYFRDIDYEGSNYIGTGRILNPGVAVSASLVTLAVSGSILVTSSNNGLLSLIVQALIVIVMLLCCYRNWIPARLYPMLLVAMALSLLWQSSLISSYIWGWDIQSEYYFSSLVLSNSIWNPTLPYAGNGVLSIVMLAPACSIICDINILWILKALYPLIFSLVPLGLFVLYNKQMNDRSAFLSVFFFISLFTFFTEMVQLARQEIAELYMVLILVVAFQGPANKKIRSVLMLIFALSLIVSHYATAYLFIVLLLGSSILLIFKSATLRSNYIRAFQPRFIALFITLTIAWYIFTSSSNSFNSIVLIGDKIAENFASDFFNPASAQGLAILSAQLPSVLHVFAKYLQILLQALIVTGIISSLIRKRGSGFTRDFLAFSLVCLGIMIAAIVIPYFASALNTSRLYQLSLICLAPFCVEGMKAILEVIRRATGFLQSMNLKDASHIVISAILAGFLLFGTGFIYDITGDNPTSFALDTNVDGPHYSLQEVEAARWIVSHAGGGLIYGDAYRWQLIQSINGPPAMMIPESAKLIKNDAYIFLGAPNVKNDSVLISRYVGVSLQYRYISSSYVTEQRLLILDTGKAQVYF